MKFKQLFCKHNWTLSHIDTKGMMMFGYIPVFYHYKCDKCGKEISTTKKK